MPRCCDTAAEGPDAAPAAPSALSLLWNTPPWLGQHAQNPGHLVLAELANLSLELLSSHLLASSWAE
jgi:hypothetical protein